MGEYEKIDKCPHVSCEKWLNDSKECILPIISHKRCKLDERLENLFEPGEE